MSLAPGLKSRSDGTKPAFAGWARLSPRRRTSVRQPWISIQGSLVNPRPDVAAEVRVGQADLLHRGIGGPDGAVEVRTHAGDAQDAAAGGDELAVPTAGAGVEDERAGDRRGLRQAPERAAGLVSARVAA